MESTAAMGRIERLDVLRGLAIIGVIAIHATADAFPFAEPGSLGYHFLILLNQCARFSVPAFLILSGFFLSYNVSNASQPTKVLKRRLAKVLPPYVSWSLIFYFLYVVLGRESFDPLSLAERILTGSVVTPYYFVVVIVQLYVVWWIVTKLGTKTCTILLLFLPVQLFFVANFYLSFMGYVSRIPWSISWMFGWSGYFLLGMMWGRKYDSWGRFVDTHRTAIVVCAIVALACSVLEFHFIYSHFDNLGAASSVWKISSAIFAVLAVLAISIIDKEISVLSKLAAGSFTIYLIHEPFLGEITPLVSGLFNHNEFISLPILIVVGLLVPYTLNHFSREIYERVMQVSARWQSVRSTTGDSIQIDTHAK
jgi:surface polysaccharide O-acyltransferase-like enzyme